MRCLSLWIIYESVMGVRDMQIGGDHYQRDIQPWDIIDCYNLTFYEGNVIKYVLRHREKNGIEDLKKAKHYLEKCIEDEEKFEKMVNQLEKEYDEQHPVFMYGDVDAR